MADLIQQAPAGSESRERELRPRLPVNTRDSKETTIIRPKEEARREEHRASRLYFSAAMGGGLVGSAAAHLTSCIKSDCSRTVLSRERPISLEVCLDASCS
jgi:hypothetical protein